MLSIERVHYPATIEEACSLLAEDERRGAISGGTSLGFSGLGGKVELVEITGLGLAEVEPDGGSLRIGANVTLQQLATSSPAIGYLGGVLREAALSVASRQVRNRATVGGGLAALYPWVDLNVLLLALGARIVTAPGGRERGIDEYLSTDQGKRLGRGELITGVVLPAPGEGQLARYVKFARTAGDISLATVATSLTLRDGKATDVRMALGGATPQPVRLDVIERRIEGSILDEASVEGAIRDHVRELAFTKDVRASRWYQERLVATLLSRAILGQGVDG